jgi:hypothetical protein
MKIPAILVVFFSAAFSSSAEYSLEDVSPHFSTNTQIIWQAPANHLPKSLWTYKKQPRVFSAETISNAVVLASFQKKGIPKPSKYRTILWADRFEGEPRPPYLAIEPDWGQISYTLGNRAPESEKVSNDQAAVERAWDCLGKLGIDRAEFVKTSATAPGTSGVFFPRQIDGLQFYDDTQGFLFQQLGNGTIRGFGLSWPKLEREKQSQIASPAQIISCIRAFKTPLSPPQNDEFNYFERIKTLSKAKKLTITSITPFYADGRFGEQSKEQETPKFVSPIAQLEAVADFGETNLTIRLLAPLLSSDVNRLLK